MSQSLAREDVKVIITISVVRASEAEDVVDNISQVLGGDGVTISDLSHEIRGLTDREWEEFSSEYPFIKDDEDETS